MSIKKKNQVRGLLGYKLKKTQHALRLHMDAALKELGLTTPQYAVLAQLEFKPGISNVALAKRSFITAQTMHGIVSNLAKSKLIKRKNDPNHGRALSITLTSYGLQTVQKAHALVHQIEAEMTITMSQDHKLLLEQLLSECLNNLKHLTHD